MSDFLTRLDINGERKLALRFPASAIKGAGAALAAAMNEEGWLIAGPAAATGPSAAWRFESIAQEGDGAFLLGPDPFPSEFGQEISSLDDAKDMERGLTRLLASAKAFSALRAEGRLPRGIVSSCLLFGEASILLLPPRAVARALSAGGQKARSVAVARLASSRSDGPESDVSFLLAQAAYRFATGRLAYEAESAEPGGVVGAGPSSAPAVLAAPRLDRGLAALVDEALADPRGASLERWTAVLESARESGWTRELPPAEEAELARRREEGEALARSRRRRADFLRKRGGLLVGAAVAIVALALVGGDILRAQRDKPDYSWLDPRELVQRYYLSIDSLDLESLEACADSKASKADRDMLANLVVVTKTRTAYEGKSPLVQAIDWVAAGKPDLAPTDFLYGIVGLAISDEASVDSNRAVFRAEYSLWSLDRPDSAPIGSASVPTEARRIDTLTVERGKRGWLITGLDRTGSWNP